jgi:hypothetical protein
MTITVVGVHICGILSFLAVAFCLIEITLVL